MANNKNFEEEIKINLRNLQHLQENRKRDCTHKPNVGAKIISVHESNEHIPNKKNFPDSTVLCTRCKDYFEANAYSASETDSAVYMFRSMLSQIKLNANLSDEDLKMIEEAYDAIDTLSLIGTFYINMVDKLTNGGNKQKNNNKRNNKSRMGIDSSMFGGRGY